MIMPKGNRNKTTKEGMFELVKRENNYLLKWRSTTFKYSSYMSINEYEGLVTFKHSNRNDSILTPKSTYAVGIIIKIQFQSHKDLECKNYKPVLISDSEFSIKFDVKG
jgi:hypothetical protein